MRANETACVRESFLESLGVGGKSRVSGSPWRVRKSLAARCTSRAPVSRWGGAFGFTPHQRTRPGVLREPLPKSQTAAAPALQWQSTLQTQDAPTRQGLATGPAEGPATEPQPRSFSATGMPPPTSHLSPCRCSSLLPSCCTSSFSSRSTRLSTSRHQNRPQAARNQRQLYRRRCRKEVEKSACSVRNGGGRVRITRVKAMIVLHISGVNK